MYLFSPAITYRTSRGSNKSKIMGQNPPSGATILYSLSEDIDKDSTLKIEILNDGKKVIRTITNKSGESAKIFDGSYKSTKIPSKKGVNRFIWNLRVNDLSTVSDISFYGSYAGYRVGPGEYTVQLTLNNKSTSQPLIIRHDPRLDIKNRDTDQHQKLMDELYIKINDVHNGINKARNIRSQIEKMNERLKNKDNLDELINTGDLAIKALNEWEGNVVQTKMETFQDVVNFLNRLNSHMINLMGTLDSSDPPITQGQKDRFGDLSEEWYQYKNKLNSIMNNEVNEFNRLYKKEDLPIIIIED